MSARSRAVPLAPAVVLLLLLACTDSNAPHSTTPPPTTIHKIQHVVIIMQENRSFDSYFGTFPGADAQTVGTPQIWNPLPFFTTVRQDSELGNVQTVDHFFADIQAGTLPAVSWVVPNGKVSEHPPALVSDGQAYVTGLINTIMQSPLWSSTAIFLAWDDWGGFYDHVPRPRWM